MHCRQFCTAQKLTHNVVIFLLQTVLDWNSELLRPQNENGNKPNNNCTHFIRPHRTTLLSQIIRENVLVRHSGMSLWELTLFVQSSSNCRPWIERITFALFAYTRLRGENYELGGRSQRIEPRVCLVQATGVLVSHCAGKNVCFLLVVLKQLLLHAGKFSFALHYVHAPRWHDTPNMHSLRKFFLTSFCKSPCTCRIVPWLRWQQERAQKKVLDAILHEIQKKDLQIWKCLHSSNLLDLLAQSKKTDLRRSCSMQSSSFWST